MPYVLGVDGGGSRTVCVLADLEGNVLGEGMSGPSNFQSVGVDNAVSAIGMAIHEATSGAPSFSFPVEAICLGLAGVDTSQDAALMRVKIESLKIGRQVYVMNDAEIALIGGLGEEHGVAIIAGTGSAAFGSDGKGNKFRVGGWGWILGDEGSGYDIGQRGLKAVVRALDGRGQATMLVASLIRRWGVADQSELVTSLRAHSWSRAEVAALAEWVTETAQLGDPIARQILSRAGEELGILATTVIAQLHLCGDFGVALTGGVFRAGNLVSESLQRRVLAVAPSARLLPALYPPVLGAVFIAWKKLSLALDPKRIDYMQAPGHMRTKQ